MAKRIPVNFTIDADVWHDLRRIVRERGYPRGVPSFLVQQAFENALLELEHCGKSDLLDCHFFRQPRSPRSPLGSDTSDPSGSALVVHPSEPAQITCSCGWSGLPADASDDGPSHPFVCPLCGADLIP